MNHIEIINYFIPIFTFTLGYSLAILRKNLIRKDDFNKFKQECLNKIHARDLEIARFRTDIKHIIKALDKEKR